MTFTNHPRLLARVAGVLYLTITALALFAYMYVRGQMIHPDDMARTAADLAAHEPLFRLGFTAAVVVTVCNLPLGFILYELFKAVNPRQALLALVFITASATLEAVNTINYITPLFTFGLPEYVSAFGPEERQALARLPVRLWAYGFSVSLVFFGAFCVLIGDLMFRSTFFPRLLGALMAVAGVCYWLDSLRLFLDLPDVPYLLRVTLVAENSVALWLIVVGINEVKWRALTSALRPAGD